MILTIGDGRIDEVGAYIIFVIIWRDAEEVEQVYILQGIKALLGFLLSRTGEVILFQLIHAIPGLAGLILDVDFAAGGGWIVAP
ncbi:MAG: hypothetical protein A4E49_00387 [Methanosaeta sp. PtaU1.Bin112]|nr:MAG: hypothetical protein A4E49_00387 [Methanosaeta sp. PtaU1.Bin112]